jgi:Acetyltransferase (GNAT) domain
VQCSIVPFDAELAAKWDALVAAAPNGTFLHTRRFLSHHADRFADASVVLRPTGRGLVGVLPAATDPANATTVVSHPGATFGGIVHDGRVVGSVAVDALETICGHYADLGYRKLRYKAVPWIYHRQPSGDDLHALVRLGAACVQRNLSCTLDLTAERRTSERRRRGARKARAAGLELRSGSEHAPALWEVLEENLSRRHGVRPVHTVDEILHLHYLFPAGIEFVVAQLGARVIAGVVLFLNGPVTHAQYIAATEDARGFGALDLVFDECIRAAAARGYRFFDFGTSNTTDGALNSTLYEFKSGFGGGGVPHDFYEISLT